MRAQLTRQEAIEEITRRLVEYFQPERIYLFGSVARGDDGPDSDLDFLVVVPDDFPVEKFRAARECAVLLPTGRGEELESLCAGTPRNRSYVRSRRHRSPRNTSEASR